MAKADLQRLTRHVKRAEALVEDQRRRVAALTPHSPSAAQAVELLRVFEETLVTAQGLLASVRHRGGIAE